MEFKKGWLNRQFAKVEKDVSEWPQWMREAMAEYKIYKCDMCGKHDALRFYFPCVDEERDTASGFAESIPGPADLCPKHMLELANHLVPGHGKMEQRRLWKKFTERAAQ